MSQYCISNLQFTSQAAEGAQSFFNSTHNRYKFLIKGNTFEVISVDLLFQTNLNQKCIKMFLCFCSESLVILVILKKKKTSGIIQTQQCD